MGDLLHPNGDGSFRMTAECRRLLMGALKRSTKLLYYIERKPKEPNQ